jgi:Zn-dependent peptidase ImmA (M78 family)/transcriptional regulator with XRE-family HTH domain
MTTNIGLRLKRARAMAGFSMQSLADATDNIVSKQAIGKYEKGDVKNINSSILLALANALDVKIDYFFKEPAVGLSNISFRKNAGLPKKDQESIKNRVLSFVEKYLEIERILNSEITFESPFQQYEINCPDDVISAAKQLRQSWGLGDAPVSNLMELLENKGIKIYEIKFRKNLKFEGLSALIDPGDIPVIAININRDLVRKRFTIAHELGHILLDFKDHEDKEEEKLCHLFASEFLLPKKNLVAELGDNRKKFSMLELKKLKGIYGISIAAILHRANKIDIISDNRYRNITIHFSKQGWRKIEPGEYLKKEKANKFKQMVFHAASEELISFSKAAELLNLSLSEFQETIQII